MCGIAGYSGDFDTALLERMNEAIAHRGPDDAGVASYPEHRVGLAHRRLSIIDLSPRGHQPMTDITGTVSIVYNGEIYNYRALREELVADGYRFKSSCDTEVLLNLYLRDGEKMMERLNGIFAFALYDSRDGSILVVRDGVGVKPLYFTQTPKGVIFSSELKALLQESSVDRSLDHSAVHHHLLYLWSPSPLTMLKAVKKLEPGCALRIRDGRIQRQWRFYELPYDQEFIEWPVEDIVVQVRKYLTQAVERQLVADVPVGAFLSGGLDSSGVVALAQRAMGKDRLQCFTIGFRDPRAISEGMADDLPYARRVAEHLDVDLQVIQVGPEMVEELRNMVFHLDEPQADPAPINALFISRLAREHGIKVLLSGAGGDDIFTGYRRHSALMLEPYWSWLPTGARSGMRAAAQRIRPETEFRRRISKAFRYADLEGDERLAAYFHWITPEQLLPILSPTLREDFIRHGSSPVLSVLEDLPASVPALNRMLFLEAKFFLADHNLNYVDKVSMASGVEVRVPMLDPDLIALAARLPLGVKHRRGTGKWILRRALSPYLPPEVISRGKTGFGAPLRHWLRDDLRPTVDDVLSETSIDRRGLFDATGVREMIERDRNQRCDASYTIFSMICIELWCRMFVDKPVPALD
ncbi:MAG: asparagine synthase (glutamine-hydrolyzing) [Myxococcota bacterium]|jgi:asparagine synthase (glutamine-hydrolysing)|nr:asparagine synthase (glutamine-hydrolyzing) [Deltaproteobacteria bacterium]MCP4244171.1 asparagine synthase (glutamine-hydrolyzing) [bacterium]MDP6076280.1 asparagine synthase (glutamine-hydrolyzing) [Myxococcota bacterium]MDP6244100.1 asparagine synthase (glutamine-hydrolyzing) [Myxococcota bacterium]MDP7073227.1 asparagine synthase (glutamine-hydrolyzing) [Myxococcota bacterium]